MAEVVYIHLHVGETFCRRSRLSRVFQGERASLTVPHEIAAQSLSLEWSHIRVHPQTSKLEQPYTA